MGLFTQKYEEDQEHKIDTPEKSLWIAVLYRAAVDACKDAPQLDMNSRANIPHKNQYTYDRDQARHFFLSGGKYFNDVCEFAGRNHIYVQQKMRKMILRKNGWNVDVPITSHYRRGPKTGKPRGRPKKKKLTGNSYYSFIGKKGGRPRMYNKLSTT